MRIALLDKLASANKIFTVAQAHQAWGAGPATKMLLSRMEKSGWIERSEHGKYMIVTLSKWTLKG